MSVDDDAIANINFEDWADRNASSPANGRRGVAPCGHPGTYVVGAYVECDQRCSRYAGVGPESNGMPLYIDPEQTEPTCPRLGCSGGPLKKWGPEYRDSIGRTFWLCCGCGRSFHA